MPGAGGIDNAVSASYITGWRSKTCETCFYRVGYSCKRLPPTIASDFTLNPSFYPTVYDRRREESRIGVKGTYIEACAEYLDTEERDRQNG